MNLLLANATHTHQSLLGGALFLGILAALMIGPALVMLRRAERAEEVDLSGE